MSVRHALMLCGVVTALLCGAPPAAASPERPPVYEQAVGAATQVPDTRVVLKATGNAQRVTVTTTFPWKPRSVRIETLVGGTWQLVSTAPTATWVPPQVGQHTLRVSYVGSSGLYTYVSTHRVMVWRNTAFTRTVTVTSGVTRVNGIPVLNKGFRVPASYAPGRNDAAEAGFVAMQRAARADGIRLSYSTAYRGYGFQDYLYRGYAAEWGTAKADTYSARPGHSEHQSGLAYDLTGNGVRVAPGTRSDQWLRANAHRFGFILRYPEGKAAVTGYRAEAWHYRYVGVSTATLVRGSGVTLDEYLAVVRPTYAG